MSNIVFVQDGVVTSAPASYASLISPSGVNWPASNCPWPMAVPIGVW